MHYTQRICTTSTNLLESNRVAGLIRKILFVCIASRIRFYSATNTEYRLLPFLRGQASVNDQLHTTVNEY